jgi:broad specificity phosphatase PhoE
MATEPPSGPRHLLLRHGESHANVRGLIASDPANAANAFGLTASGSEQIRRAVAEARAAGLLDASCRVVSSPLLRARESAAIVAESLGSGVRVDARLTERGFGALELTSDRNYDQVWAADREDPAHEGWGVESVTAILRRATALLRDLEAGEPAGTFVLCTHGDVASVLLCAARGHPLGRHREVGALGNGGIGVIGGVAALGAPSVAPGIR